MLSFFAYKSTKKLLFIIVISAIALTISVASVDIAHARPAKQELPKPYFPRLGDGDTINRKFLSPGMFEGEIDYSETGPVYIGTGKRDTQRITERILIIKWSILYQLIKY